MISTETVPRSLMVLRGGAVCCELGQVFARFGVEVTIIEGAERLLRGEEPETSYTVLEMFNDEGITVPQNHL